MARIFYVHWNKDECLARAKSLRTAGHTVRAHHSTGEQAWKLLKQKPPDLLVVSLERLPSHGRRVAAVTTATKRLQAVPIIFAGGEPDKIKVARKEFPQATFCSANDLLDALPAETVKVRTTKATRKPPMRRNTSTSPLVSL